VKSDAIDWDEEVVRARQACEQSLDDAEPSLRLAQALVWIGQADEAADVLLKLTHVFDEAVSDDIGLLLRVFTATCDELDRAERKYDSIPIRRRWAQVDPIHQGNLFQLSLLLAGVGEIDESLAYCRRLLELDARHTGAAANFLLYTNYSDRYCTAEISNEHFRIGMRFTQPSDALPARPRMAAEKVRVGYLGSDFYTHPVGKIMLPLLQSHDRQRIEINVYHDGKKSDATTESIKKTVDYFTYVNGWSDERLIESVRMDELDVLIDLGGYTGGGNRLLALARRLAPVQASFLGYPHTSAIPAMDYRLTDRFADPPGLTDHLYGERLVWLEHAHLAWRPYDLAEKTLAVPCVQPLLGVFNNVAKISPSAIATYATILRRVPLASIVFKYGDRFGVSTLRDRYRQAFAAHGVPPHRLLFRTQTETLAEHLQTMANVDLALDSFPYQGTMTSLECLCVGTPIISCCGDYYAHRATSAMMIQMGLHELVADDVDEYVEIAVELLHDRGRLPGLRDEILDRFYASTLTDPRGLACELESIYKSWVG
jgi:predicted O-linked N-acetylglucosamine transferase (SPINDLY family)